MRTIEEIREIAHSYEASAVLTDEELALLDEWEEAHRLPDESELPAWFTIGVAADRVDTGEWE